MSIISNCTATAIKDAAATLIKGNLVAFPTETVYGLGADATNKDAISDGDEFGKGTGVFLDTANGGSSVDTIERISEIKINEYQKNKPYTTPSA